MDITEATATEDLWTPYKELVAVVEGYLTREGSGPPYAVHTFEAVLRRHKQTFLSLLKNPPKNPTSRDEVRRGITEGVNLPSVGRTLLSKELVEEAVILSDMYEVNEYLSLELVHTAQRQMPRHPGLPRGLVAVLLYYDGRRALAQALKDLVMARDGVSWSIPARDEIIKYVTRYVDQLISDGLLGSSLDALRKFSLSTELELLQNNRALPPPNHHNRLVDTIESTRKLLAGVVFAASAQRGLSRDILLRLISEQTKSPTQGPTGSLDEISLALQMALLYALDLSVLHRREDGEELAKKLPLIQDVDLISVLLDELSPPANTNQATLDGAERASSGVRALCQLALGLALAALKRAPQSLLRSSGQEMRSELLDQDEALVDAAVDGKVFEYLDEVVLSSELVAKEEYYQRRLHTLLTDFIHLMHSKLTEMRIKADEAARAVQMYLSEGISPPQGAGAPRTRLDALLRCVDKLYSRDPLGLRHDYWLACETHHDHSYRSGGRAATLYKFVRLAGSLATPALLPGYLRALAALCVPRHTWALLATAPLSAHHLLHALAQYKHNLRVEAPFSDHAHASMGASGVVTAASRPGRLLVRREEVDAMVAALRLIAAVARQDAAAAAAICDNLQWDAVNVMFGLICCHIPLHLKAELCITLAALGGTATTAGRVWAGMEAAQLVSVTKDIRGLNAELQEVECRMEEYPLSRAFLTLLTSLCSAAPLPRALGAGARAAGLDPYVDHVLTRLTLPAPHRTYAKPQEKWQVLSLCLGLLVKWLDSYEPSGSDFPSARGVGGVADVSPPPGLHVALRLHSGDELLRLIVLVLKEAQGLLAVRGAQQVYIEECLISSLQLLERALAIERALTQAAAEAGRSVLIVGLSKLILGASGSPDDCPLLAACRVLPHTAMRPLAAAKAVALLVRATKNAAAARHILAASAANRVTAAEIRHGFVECLEAEEWSDTAAEALKQAKEGVLTILHQTLPNAAPNFAHFLLGYQLSEDVSRSQLNEPGAAGFPRTCLHSVLDLLDQHVAGADHADRQASDLVESSYRLVYLLCARAATSPPALRFLRSRDYFLSRHVKARVNLETASPATVSARSWVLRACACELGGAAGSRQHAALAALIRTLAPHSDRHAQEWEYCLLRQSLSALRISVEPAREPRWELLNAQLLRQAIASADIPTGLGGKRISVSRVHALLARELVALQATAAQRNLLADEIQKVLDYVTEINRRRNLAATVTHYYDSWRQLTEILFCVAPNDILDLEARKNLLLNILQDLLNKIPPAEVLPQIGNLASGTVLLLLVNLRHCYIIQKRDSNLKSQDFEASFFGPSNHIMQTKSLTLKFVLHKILSWILVSGGSTQKMRVNLYGALLNYLNIVNLKTSTAESKDDTNINESYVSRLDSSKGPSTREESALKNMVVDVISEFGENLCSIVCGDCIGAGHDVCRMVALSCLDTLVEINPQTDWMHTLTDQGYLRSLIDSLLQDDDGLQQALETNPKTLRVLYVYESKMALLIKIAGTVMGAACVLAAGTLSCLANMKALGCHPDVLAATETEAQPTRVHRFRQILIPALALCDALLTTLGTQNHSCVIHVTHFLLSHVECVDMVLRAAHPNSPNGLLIEVDAFTAVIARASNREVFGYVKQDTSLQQCAASSSRVQGLMLALIPRFANPPPQQEQDDSLLYHKIVSNLVTYARNILERDSSRVLFRPALLPADVSGNEGAGGGAPHCGAILDLLQSSVRRCHQQSKLLLTVSHQLQNVPTMTLEDMKKLLPPDSAASSPSEVRIALVSCLTRRVSLRRRSLQYCRHAAEGALYLAWAHLQVYHRASHTQLLDNFNTSLTPSSALRGAFGADLVELRKGLVGVFNERFAEQLLDIAKDQTPAQRCFLEVLLKDIKSMIQFSPL